MTRDEAITKAAAVELLQAGAPTSYSNRVVASNFVAIAQALGMLKLDEPKAYPPAAVTALNMLFSSPGGVISTISILDQLRAAGLKIVEK